MSLLQFEAGPGDAGKRIDVVVAERAGISRSAAATLSVLVDGVAAAKSLRLEAGNRVQVEIPDVEASLPPSGEDIDIEVVYEDPHMIVVSKPAGLVVHPAPGHSGGTLVNALLARDEQPAGGDQERPGIVHRLDAGTSGLMVVAKTDEAFERLSSMMAAREVKRTYIALVEGVPESEAATIDAPIGRSPRHRKKMAVVAEGREAITHYEVKEALGEIALLEVVLETGRTHQIRVHLAEIGHPVIGDPVYGRSRKAAARLGLNRPFLHATRLEMSHPIDGNPLSFESPLPPDLAAALDVARQ